MTAPRPPRCAVTQPVLTSAALIAFRCGCGWESAAVRPETRGAFVDICDQYRQHLTDSGYYPEVAPTP